MQVASSTSECKQVYIHKMKNLDPGRHDLDWELCGIWSEVSFAFENQQGFSGPGDDNTIVNKAATEIFFLIFLLLLTSPGFIHQTTKFQDSVFYFSKAFVYNLRSRH